MKFAKRNVCERISVINWTHLFCPHFSFILLKEFVNFKLFLRELFSLCTLYDVDLEGQTDFLQSFLDWKLGGLWNSLEKDAIY